jgi:hypothetical protein
MTLNPIAERALPTPSSPSLMTLTTSLVCIDLSRMYFYTLGYRCRYLLVAVVQWHLQRAFCTTSVGRFLVVITLSVAHIERPAVLKLNDEV